MFEQRDADRITAVRNNQDLIVRFMADRTLIEQRIQSGQISTAESDEESATAWSNAVTQMQARNNSATVASAAAQSAWAQQQAATAATMRALNSPAPPPPAMRTTTCLPMGNAVSCTQF